LVDNGGCGDNVTHWCENRCGAAPACYLSTDQLSNAVPANVSASLVLPRPADDHVSESQCHDFLMQRNMSNPEEHCNMGFESLVMEEGGAFRYYVRLGEPPAAGTALQMQVSGAFTQYESTTTFTAADWDTAHEIEVVVAENLNVTGDYWMTLVHTFTTVYESGNSGNGEWWTSREPMVLGVGGIAASGFSDPPNLGWDEAKLWCLASGAAYPLSLPVLVVDNDVSSPDQLLWQLQTLVHGADDTWTRGPFTLDSTYFGTTSGFWNDAMPDAAFRIDGAANGTTIFRPCDGAGAPANCAEICTWTELVRPDNGRPTIYVAFDEPCFVEYPPPADTLMVDLFATVTTDSSETQPIWITM
jgi:hypothetical protein